MHETVEHKIREAMARGEFDDLPGTGEPLTGLDRPYDPDWWVKAWVERDRQANRNAETLREAERMARRMWAAPSLERLTDLMDDIDRERSSLGLAPLDRAAAAKMWAGVRRHQTARGVGRSQN